MREILFRGRRGDNGEWIYGTPFQEYSNFWCEWEWIIQTKHPLTNVPYMHLQIDGKTVGQFTGLTDKNGKRAFEHDVIKHHFGDEIGVIRYGEYRNPFGDDSHGGHVGFYVDWVSGKNPELLRKDLGYWMKIVEIIGNIHDNPELLGGVGDG